jgi:hypothetical protein
VHRGYADVDIWGLDYTIAKFVLPRLMAFRRDLHGHPPNLEHKEWEEILDKIIYAMASIVKDEEDIAKDDIIEWEKVQEGCELFGQYFHHLWD